MAVKVFTGAWSDTTEQTVLAAACRVTSIEITPHPEQSTQVFLCFWDASNPTPGTTDTYFTFPIGTITTQGRRKRKIVFPGGGLRFATACTMFLATTPEVATAVTGSVPDATSLPAEIRVHFAVGN